MAAGVDRGTLNIYRTAMFGRVAGRASWLCALAKEFRDHALVLMTRTAFSALDEDLRRQCEVLDDSTPEHRRRREALGIDEVILMRVVSVNSVRK